MIKMAMNTFGNSSVLGLNVCLDKYDCVCDFEEGLAAVNLNGKWGVINCLGIEVIPLIFNDLWTFNFASVVKLDNKYGLLNYDGEYILPCQYDTINVFNERIIATKSDTNYEFNLSGELLNIRNIEDVNFYWVF